jgi:hypothetical protein
MDELLAHHITLNLNWFLSFDLPSKGDPVSSYATTGIALRVTGTCKPPHWGGGDVMNTLYFAANEDMICKRKVKVFC